MNRRFFVLCVWAIVLSMYLRTTYANLNNESSNTNGWRSMEEEERANRVERLDDLSLRRFFTQRLWVNMEGSRRDGKTENDREEQQVVVARNEGRNCTERSIVNFPADLWTNEQRRHGAVAMHAFFAFYCFILTAFVCNDYLLPSLDRICAGLKIRTDIAGATFLAAASCFPELFVNVVGTFLTESDLGVGTVVGGAVFNTFATPACGALSALYGIQLEWKILSRDCAIYAISVGTLVIMMWDGLIEWYEATILMAFLVGYLALLFCGESMKRCYVRVVRLCTRKSTDSDKATGYSNEAMPEGSYKPYFHNELIVEYKKRLSATGSLEQRSARQGELGTQDASHYPEADIPIVWPKNRSAFEKTWFLFTWPLRFLLFVTIPDSRFQRFKSWYPLTFFMCVVWIAISSYLVSWMTTIIGDTLGIPDSVMGITFLSAGGNMPELVTIVILSKQGEGDMAMSNTLGANTLDILLCLGLPWTIKILITGTNVEIVSGALSYSVASIVLCVVILYAVIALCGFKLNKKVGAICLVLYTIFLIFAILIELNVFFFVNLPMCEP